MIDKNHRGSGGFLVPYMEGVGGGHMVDLFLELFKGLAPTIVAILAIVVNNALSRKREQTSQRISRVRLVNSGKMLRKE